MTKRKAPSRIPAYVHASYLLVSLTLLLLSLQVIEPAAQEAPTSLFPEARTLHKQAWDIHRIHDQWTVGGEASKYIFLHMPQFYRHALIDRGGAVRHLPEALRDDVTSFTSKTSLGDLPLSDYVAREASAVDGFLVVHEGRVVFEAYPEMEATDKHIYFSVSKVFVSTAVAILEQRGLIDVNEHLPTYFPTLKGTAWDEVRVIEVLDMSSGMDCPFAIGDMDSCFEEFFVAYGSPLAYHIDESMPDPIDYVAQIPSKRPAGEAFDYQDLNPLLLTLLVERLSGMPFAVFLEKEIWQRMGAASDAVFMTAANGRVATPLGASSTLRDMARFGLLFTPSGRTQVQPVLSEEALAKIQFGGRPELFEHGSFPNMFGGEPGLSNTYQWDHVTVEGDFYKDGHAGQGLYVSPSRDLVIAFFGSWAAGQTSDDMPAVARQLATSGLFDLE